MSIVDGDIHLSIMTYLVAYMDLAMLNGPQ